LEFGCVTLIKKIQVKKLRAHLLLPESSLAVESYYPCDLPGLQQQRQQQASKMMWSMMAWMVYGHFYSPSGRDTSCLCFPAEGHNERNWIDPSFVRPNALSTSSNLYGRGAMMCCAVLWCSAVMQR
jgi:hypothetical protein